MKENLGSNYFYAFVVRKKKRKKKEKKKALNDILLHWQYVG
jgi:hypothetical protein